LEQVVLSQIFLPLDTTIAIAFTKVDKIHENDHLNLSVQINSLKGMCSFAVVMGSPGPPTSITIALGEECEILAALA
jgi:GTP-binding protein EngB required for normal cell division